MAATISMNSLNAYNFRVNFFLHHVEVGGGRKIIVKN